jgi:N-acetylglucosamine-6-phosphate deacetylase
LTDAGPQAEIWIVNATIVTPGSDEFAKGVVRIRDGVIAAVGTAANLWPPADAHVIDAAGDLLVPGFVDLHVHGGGGGDFGTVDRSGIGEIVRTHWKSGTTTMLASVMTAPRDDMNRALKLIANEIEDPEYRGTLAGINLEGPFISQEYAGAHDTALLRQPSTDALLQLLKAGRGRIRLMTIAPERPKSSELIDVALSNDVMPAIGHTAASYEECRDAIRSGATHFTHLFNAMTPFHHRNPGAVGAALLEEGVSVELILDGEHLSNEAFRLALRSCGPQNIIAITDATMLTGTKKRKAVVGGSQVRRRGARVENDASVLAGSCLTMAAAFKHLVKTLDQDLISAVRMTSTNASRVLGRNDLGHIREGFAANLVLLSRSSFAVRTVVVRGEVVHGQADAAQPARPYTKTRDYDALRLAARLGKGAEAAIELRSRVMNDLTDAIEELGADEEALRGRLEDLASRLESEVKSASRIYHPNESSYAFQLHYSERIHRLLSLEQYYQSTVSDFTPFWGTLSADEPFLDNLFRSVLRRTWKAAASEGYRPKTSRIGGTSGGKSSSCFTAFDAIGVESARRLWQHYVEGLPAQPTPDDQQEYFKAWMRSASVKLHTAVEDAKYRWVIRNIARMARCGQLPEEAPLVLLQVLEGKSPSHISKDLCISKKRGEELVALTRSAAVAAHQTARAYDFHVHTQASDGADPPDWILQNLQLLLDVKDLDGLAITDHDCINPKIAEAIHDPQYGARIFVGEEVELADGTEMGCVLFHDAVPANLPFSQYTVTRGAGVDETSAEIRERQGVVYLTHPRGRSFSFLEVDGDAKRAWMGRHLADHPLAVELTNAKNASAANMLAWDEFDEMDVSRLGGSDAHWLELDLGQGFMICEALDGTRDDFIRKTKGSLVLPPLERGEEWKGLQQRVGEYARHPKLR